MTVPSVPKQASRPAIALVAAAIAALLAMSFLALAHPAFLARPAFAADAPVASARWPMPKYNAMLSMHTPI